MAGFRYYLSYLPQGQNYTDSVAINGEGSASAVGKLEMAATVAIEGESAAEASGASSFVSSVSFSGEGFISGDGNIVMIYSPVTISFSLVQSEISIEVT